jgi:molybdopterin converting factor small subunit
MTISSDDRPIRVRLFARYAELIGSESIELRHPGLRSVSDVVAAVRALPGGGSIPARPLVALNLEQAAAEQAVAPGDEVALLPPLAGG